MERGEEAVEPLIAALGHPLRAALHDVAARQEAAAALEKLGRRPQRFRRPWRRKSE